MGNDAQGTSVLRRVLAFMFLGLGISGVSLDTLSVI